jgi:hypothetical protein
MWPFFKSATRAAYVGKYQALGLATANSMSGEEFFDLLGRPARRGDLLGKIRHIESSDIAEPSFNASARTDPRLRV